jgi:hypothetical protein
MAMHTLASGRFRQEDPARAADRQTGSLAALAVTLLLLVASLYLVDRLERCADIQDCVMSGRAGCADLP